MLLHRKILLSTQRNLLFNSYLDGYSFVTVCNEAILELNHYLVNLRYLGLPIFILYAINATTIFYLSMNTQQYFYTYHIFFSFSQLKIFCKMFNTLLYRIRFSYTRKFNYYCTAYYRARFGIQPLQCYGISWPLVALIQRTTTH